MANPIITIDTNNPDPTKAINAFLWCMNKALELGMVPPTEHTLAAHMFRKNAGVVFYSSAGGVTSIVLDKEQVGDDLDDEMLDMAIQIIRRRRKAKRESAQGIEAGTVETERLDAQHESPVGTADAPKGGSHDQ